MKNNLFRVSIILLLCMFSFYYTEKVIDFVKEKDPIMQIIKKESVNHEIKPTNAKITDNKIIPGVYGTKVDYNSSYEKMKKYGTYNESLTVFSTVEPTISIEDYYDKFISQGNGINNDISLVFIVDQMDNIDTVIQILTDTNVKGTFFIDGLWLENNNSIVTKLKELNHEIEILSYDNKYDELYFRSSLNLLNGITNIKPKYCLAKYDSKEVIELCTKLELHTIIPTIQTSNYPYSDIKKKLSRGSIISFDINSATNIELPAIIQYIKQKGYVINTLDILLNEAIIEK